MLDFSHMYSIVDLFSADSNQLLCEDMIVNLLSFMIN